MVVRALIRSASGMAAALIIASALSLAAAPPQQAAPAQDVWKEFRVFLGRWQGQGEGQGGVSKGQQEWALALRDRYIEVSNLTVFDPQEKNPKGERHEDRGFISYDQGRKAYVFRQFHVEGFVNQYVCSTPCPAGKVFTFVSESIENLPAGFKARLTYEVLSNNEFRQTFDLAEPGKDFTCYSQGVMKKR